MAAYAALVSLLNNMEQNQNHPFHSFSFDEKQIESLHKNVCFLLDFIDCYNSHGGSKEAEDLESQIASAAYAAEDVIESHVVDQILGGSTLNGKTSSCFLVDLQKVIEEMDSIKKMTLKVKAQRGFRDQLPIYSKPATSSRSLTTGKNAMVGFDDELIQLMERLTRQQPNRQLIPIVGMGGIGKTTLARNVYEHLLIVQHFDVLLWATVSQEYSVEQILLELLSCLKISASETVHKLGEKLHKCLSGKRYLIILDDMWSLEAWDEIQLFLPDNGNGSCIVITTRLSNMAVHLSFSPLVMNFLDEDKSWKLFWEKAFGEEDCPPELVKIGLKIVKLCRGLPLSIVVIGGHLGKSSRTKEYWENFANDISSILNSEEDQQCLNILSLSYEHLPAHLKPCFLYIGIFPEDDNIRVSELVKLWVAEGFLKPNKAQSLEEVAEGYLKDLVGRNLVLVRRWGSNGKVKTCNIHDLLRELCLRIAKKERFFHVMESVDISRAINRERRIVIHESMSDDKVFHAPESGSLVRSLKCKGRQRFNSRLLRVLNAAEEEVWDGGFLEADFMCVNLRCLDRRFVKYLNARVRSSHHYPSLYLPRTISLVWNLQTISIKGCNARIVAPSEIWEMRQLRHLKVDHILYLPDPPRSDRVDHVLQNLQTLGKAVNFGLSEEVCKRIPNIKKLYIIYAESPQQYKASTYYCPQNIGRFHKLESLNIDFRSPYCRDYLLLNITFPSSLQKLTLLGSDLYWKDLSMIGSLPNLEVLKLDCDSVRGSEWNPVEGEFRRLKFLKIHACTLTKWNADYFHFPVLENLVLGFLKGLDGIPLGIGEISTLRFIRVSNCSFSCALSAVKILEEQESLGNEDLQVEVQFHCLNNRLRFREKMEEEGFTSNNLQQRL